MRLALAIGLFIAAVGGVGIVAPHAFDETARYTVTPVGLYVAGAVRVAIGAVLIRVAAASRAPRLLRVLGFLAILAGIGTLFLGVGRARAIVAWWSNEGPVLIRLWPALALIFGLAIVWAVLPRRRVTRVEGSATRLADVTSAISEAGMAGNVGAIPESVSVIIPRLVCRDPAAAIEFYTRTFGAVERLRRPGPDGAVAHAMLTIGPAMLMIEGEWPSLPSRAPKPDGSSPVVVYLYVENADETVERAVANGGRVLVPLQNQFWGDRIAWILDPAGHVWTVAMRIEDTTAEERTDRWSAILADKERA